MSLAERDTSRLLSRRALLKGAGATVGSLLGLSSLGLPETFPTPLFSRDESALTTEDPFSLFRSAVSEKLRTQNGEFQQTFNDEEFGQLLLGLGNQLIKQELPNYISPKEFDASISEIKVQSSNARINLTGKVHEKALIIPHTDTITAEVITDSKSGELLSVSPHIHGSVVSKILEEKGISTEDIASALQDPNDKVIKGLNMLFKNEGVTVDSFKLFVLPQQITIQIAGNPNPTR